MTKAAQTQQEAEPSNPPVAKVRVGLVNASIWARTTDKGRFYAVTFERRYRTKEGDWQSSHSYDTGDLLELAKAADLAHSKILELRSADASADE